MADLEVTVPQTVALLTVPDVELVAAGTWRASTGITTFTDDDLAQAVAALDCPGIRNPVLKLGHEEDDPDGQKMRWDGEPAVGWIDNMRLNDTATKIIGDFAGMPAWLAEALPSAYPDRSIEIYRPFMCQIGHTHPAVITAVALLGVTAPGVGVLKSLQDVRALYTAAGTGQRITITLSAGGTSRPASVLLAQPPVAVPRRLHFANVPIRSE